MGKSKDLATGAAYQDQTESDTRYVNASGDTVTGALTVDTSTTTNLTVDSGNYGGIQFKAAGTDTGYITSYTNGSGAESMYIGGADAVYLHTGTNHGLTNGTTRLGIDGSGHVTMPNQPCFGARGYSGTTTQIGGYNPMLWVNVHTNVGNCFSNSTGKFTFPVSGRYYVECNINLKNTDASWLGLYFLYNTSVQANSWSMNQPNTQYNDTIVSGVVDATANDYCAFCWHNSYIAPAGSAYVNYNYANIFFIG